MKIVSILSSHLTWKCRILVTFLTASLVTQKWAFFHCQPMRGKCCSIWPIPGSEIDNSFTSVSDCGSSQDSSGEIHTINIKHRTQRSKLWNAVSYVRHQFKYSNFTKDINRREECSINIWAPTNKLMKSHHNFF